MGLLELPAELRNRIYHFVLVRDSAIAPQTRRHRKEERQAIALLGVCRQVREESHPIYYMKSSFRFYYSRKFKSSPKRWLTALRPNTLLYIRPFLLQGRLRGSVRCAICKSRIAAEIDINKKDPTIVDRAKCCRLADFFMRLQDRFRDAVSSWEGCDQTADGVEELVNNILDVCSKRFVGWGRNQLWN